LSKQFCLNKFAQKYIVSLTFVKYDWSLPLIPICRSGDTRRDLSRGTFQPRRIFECDRTGWLVVLGNIRLSQGWVGIRDHDEKVDFVPVLAVDTTKSPKISGFSGFSAQAAKD
jgi:hypothetical protein